MTKQFPIMRHENLDVSKGDMDSPEWIVRNVVIDMAGYYAHNFADQAVIDDDEMTYSLRLFDNERSAIVNKNYNDETGIVTLTFQSIWNTMYKIARTNHVDWSMSRDIANDIRAAVFDHDGGDLDSVGAVAIIECAIFGKVMY
jgi:hypothetical protein